MICRNPQFTTRMIVRDSIPSTADRYFSECFSAPSECHGANGGVDFMKHGGFGVPSTYCNNIRGSDCQHLPPKGVNGSNEL
jgi:hypothetical protein